MHICDRKVTFPMLRVGEQKITRRAFVIESAFLAASEASGEKCVVRHASPPAPPIQCWCGGIGSWVGARARSNIEWGVRGDRGEDGLKEVRMD